VFVKLHHRHHLLYQNAAHNITKQLEMIRTYKTTRKLGLLHVLHCV